MSMFMWLIANIFLFLENHISSLKEVLQRIICQSEIFSYVTPSYVQCEISDLYQIAHCLFVQCCCYASSHIM